MENAQLTLREWRRLRNKTLQQMADVCGTNINTYHRWEQSPEKIKINNMLAILKELDISMDNVIFMPSSTTKM